MMPRPSEDALDLADDFSKYIIQGTCNGNTETSITHFLSDSLCFCFFWLNFANVSFRSITLFYKLCSHLVIGIVTRWLIKIAA